MWARLGYSIEEAGQLAKNTAILMNVSEFDDVTEATDTLISALQAFKNEETDVATYSMQIIDEMNEVGNAYAISTSDLANSLTRSSAALAAANNTLEESIAMTTAANTIIQDPEAVGNALKVVSMRIRGVSTELEAAGEDTEGVITNTAKLQEKIMALTNIDGDGGINILANDGSFKSTYQILLEISKVWDKIDDTSQAGLLEVLAGKVRGSTVAALLSGGDIMERAYKSASGAKGSAQEELDKYLDSIDGKITQFNNSLQTMWMNLIDSEFIKSVVDTGTDLIKFLDTVPGKITAIAAALAGFAKFKGFSIMGLGKDAGKTFQSYQQALSKLNSLKTMNVQIGTDDSYNTSAVLAYANAVDGLTAKKQAELLATAGLNKAQIIEVMNRNNIGGAVIEETLNKMNLVNVTKGLHTTTVQAALATQLSTDVMQEKAVADFLAANGSKRLTSELLAQMVQQKILTQEQAAGILMNNKLAFSWKALAQSIKMAFLSNPVGWIATIATTVIPLVASGIGAITQSTEEAAEAARNAADSSEELRRQGEQLSGYKNQIQELRTELSSNNLSEQEAYEVREKLLTIQDELVNKYGLERDGLNLVTGAINEQIAAIDELTRKKAQQWLNTNQKSIHSAIDYFDSGTKGGYLDDELFGLSQDTTITNWGSTKKVSSAIDRYASGRKHMETSGVSGIGQDISFKGSAEEVKQEVEDFQDWLGDREIELEKQKTDLLALPDQTDDVKKQIASIEKDILQLQDVREDLGVEYTNWFGSDSAYAANKALLEETQYNTALTQYEKEYSNILQAQKDLADAQAKGNKDDVAQALDTINAETAAAAETAEKNGQSYMVNFFNGIKEGYTTLTKDMEISESLSTAAGKNALSQALFDFKDKNAKEILQAYEIDPNDSAFVELKAMADSYGISVEELIQSLVRLGYVQGNFDSGISEKTDVAVSTIDTLTSAVEAYKTALEHVNNITFDGQAISEDYYKELKGQLADITVGTEEFSDAIEEQNGKYIVKNVALLKKLIAQSRQAKKATVEVARSQAQLQYRNIVDQMRNAVMMMGIEYEAHNLITDATFDNISAMREQIETLRQAIQQYALLEVSLSNAASAYDKYEAAKERDAQLSYDESFLEMLKTIDEGLLKNETGSEAFEYSTRAVVPEEVWGSIEDPNKKVKAIHDYIDGDPTFSKLFHVDEESGNLDITADNVREFIKLSKEAGMITGGPEGFELSDTVYGTKEWADALGVTEAAVLALLSATEDCDALWGNILTDVMTHPLDREINKSVDEVDKATKELEDYLKLVQETNSDDDETNDVEFDSEHYSELVAAIGAATDKLDENRQAALDNAQTYTTVQAALSSFRGDLTLTDDEASNLVNSLKEIEGLENLGEIAIEDGKLKLTDEQITLILTKLGKLTEPSIVQIQLRYDEISKEIDQINEYIEKGSTGSITIDGIVFTNGADADGNIIEDYLAKLTAEQKEIQLTYSITETSTADQKSVLESYQEIAKNGVSFTVTANVTQAKDSLSSVSDEQKKINENQEITVTAYADTAAAAIKAVVDELAKVQSKEITITVHRVGDIGDLGAGGGVVGDGTNALGNAMASGNVGLKSAEHGSIVGELGPEMVVDPIKGIYYTVGDNGTEMVNLPKGAIIYNHKQTAELLKNGYTTRGKYTGGLSFAKGNAYSSYGIPSYHPNLKDETSFKNGTGINNKWNDAASALNGSSSKLSNAADKLSDASDEFEEVFDWIEVRLEEINEDISLKGAELENAIGYSAKNTIIDNMISLNNNLYNNLIAGANEYYNYSKALLSKIPSAYREAAQDGTIAIEKFVGEVDEKTLTAIQDYREWVQKGADATQQAEEVLTEIQSLAKQAFDNIVDEFENKLSLNDSKIDRFDSHNSLLETDKGFESENIYQAMIDENESKLKLLEQQASAMQAELDSGKIEKYSDAWYEAVNAIAEVDTEIVNLQTEVEDLQDSINELHWEKFEVLMKQFEAINDEAEDLLDILGQEDAVDEFGKWTDKGITSLGLLAQRMEVAEMKAQQYKEEIEYLNENWEKLGYTQEEYIDKLDELKSGQYDSIKAYHDAKDAIVDLNKERVDAIKDGIEKEIDAYEELIDKKKEALDADKDAHDWQKSVAEQQKNISDIERQIAALSADNSISARAKRAQLEAELLEAKAEMDEMYYDRTVEKQKEALDKELESFQETKEDEIEDWEKYLENVELVVSDTIAMVQENTQTVLETLTILGQEFGLTITEALTNPWKAGETAIQNYGEKLNMSLTELTALFGMTVDEFAAKLDLTTEGLVSKLDITIAEMATSLGLTQEQLAAKLGLTTADLSGKMNMTIQQFATSMGYTIPQLANKFGTTTSGLVGNLNMTMTQFAGRLGLTVDQLAGKFGLTTKDLASKLGQTYQQLTNPFGMSMSSTVDALKSLEKEYQKILNDIESQSLATVSRVNHAMEKYTNKTNNNNTSTTSKPKTVTLGSRINAGSAKIYSDSYGGGAGTQYYGNDPIYTVIGENNGYWLVRYHKLSSGYTGWFKKSDVKAYAKGTTNIPKDQWALIDELGDELQLIPDGRGRLSYMKKGTGVVPADLTANLMEWGKLDPSVMLDQNRPQIGASPSVVNNTTEIHIDASVGELLHVEHLDGNNPAEITKIVDKAWDKRMKELNSFVRKYSR